MSDFSLIFPQTSGAQHHTISPAIGKTSPDQHDNSLSAPSSQGVSLNPHGMGSTQNLNTIRSINSNYSPHRQIDYWRDSPDLANIHQKIRNIAKSHGTSNDGTTIAASNIKLPVAISLMSVSDDDEGDNPPSPVTSGGGGSGGGVEAPPGQGDEVPVTGYNPGSGGLSNTGDGYTPPGNANGNLPPSPPEEIEVHARKVKVINGVQYLEGSKGLVTYVTHSGGYASLKISDLDNEINKAAQDIGDSEPDEKTIQSIYDYFSSEEHNINDVRSLYAHSDRIRDKVEKDYNDVLNRMSDAYEMKKQLDSLGNNDNLNNTRFNLAHSDEATALYKNLISQVQDRVPSSNDDNWTNAQKDLVGKNGTYKQVRYDLAHFYGEAWVIDPYWQNMLGRPPTDAERGAVEDKLADTSTIQGMRVELAHSDLVINALAKAYEDETGQSLENPQNLIPTTNISDDMANKGLTLERIKSLLEVGAKLPAIDQNSPVGHYTPIEGLPTNTHQYTDGSGRVFGITENYSLRSVAEDGELHKTDDKLSLNFMHLMHDTLGHGGKFDAQRDNNLQVSYKGLVDNANYNVGVWGAAVGLLDGEIEALGLLYIVKNDLHVEAFSTLQRDLPLWIEGYNDYKSGYIK